MDVDTLTLKLISEAFKVGYTQAVIDCGNLKPYLSMTEAANIYGMRVIKGWIDERLIEPVQDKKTTAKGKNAKIRLDRIKLMTIAATANRN